MEKIELDQLKEKAQKLLTKAEASGRLSPDETSYRKEAVRVAADFGEIDRQLTDILAVPTAPSASSETFREPMVIPARAASAFCLMGERKLHGSAMGDQTATVTIMGSMVINLSDMAIDRPVVIDCVTVMGETIVLLPPGTPVDIRLAPIMAAVTEDRNLEHSHQGPRVIFQGAVVMGEVKISYR